MDKQRIINQLIDIYYTKEPWHVDRLSKEEAGKYFNSMITDGNIIYEVINDKLIGYVEFWKINTEQFNRLASRKRFNYDEENLVSGNICWVSNIYIEKEFRRSKIIKDFKRKWLERINDCYYITGHHTKSDNIKIHKNKEVINHGKW